MAKVFVELNDCRSFEHLEEGDFAMGGLFIFRVHVIEVNLFERVFFAIDDVFEECHLSCSTLTNWSELLILCQACQLVRILNGEKLFAILHLLCQRPTLLHSDGLDEVVKSTKLQAL